MFRPEVIDSRRLQKAKKNVFGVTNKSLLFIAYFSESKSSVTICSTRNDKQFEKFKKLTFWQFFQKINERGQKVKFKPFIQKHELHLPRKDWGGEFWPLPHPLSPPRGSDPGH